MGWIRKTLKGQKLPTLYSAVLNKDVVVRDWDMTEHTLKGGETFEVLLEINCADGAHVRIKTPGITAPTWLHKNLVTPVLSLSKKASVWKVLYPTSVASEQPVKQQVSAK